jgi:hypothetical protein
MLSCYKTTFSMRGRQKEQWMHLCELIAEERDPVRFAELTKQLLVELEAKDRRLKVVTKEGASNQPDGSDNKDTTRPDDIPPVE